MPLDCGVYNVEPTLSHAIGVAAHFERGKGFIGVYTV